MDQDDFLARKEQILNRNSAKNFKEFNIENELKKLPAKPGVYLMHRKKYAPDILGEIKDVLDEIEERGDLLPKSELQEAITYLRNEWNAVVDIFNYGDTYLDNNMVERMNRYISLSRKNSLFFGSHKGAERGAILYTIALTCRMHKVNLFEYLTDVINRTAEWQPNTPIEKYRELLPDRWEKAND